MERKFSPPFKSCPEPDEGGEGYGECLVHDWQCHHHTQRERGDEEGVDEDKNARGVEWSHRKAGSLRTFLILSTKKLNIKFVQQGTTSSAHILRRWSLA